MSVENYILPGKPEEVGEPEEIEEDWQSAKAVDPVEQRLEAAGITAETLKKYLYTFKSSGGELVDLTNDGMNYIARCAGVSIDDVEIIADDERSITVKATAINQDGERHISVVQGEKFSGSYPNRGAIRNAVSIAQRYAKKGLLPITFLQHLMKQATGGLRTVDEQLHKMENATDYARNQRAEISELKAQVKRLEEENTKLRGEWERE